MKRKPTIIELTNTADTKADFLRLRTLLGCVSGDATRPVLHNVEVESEDGLVTLTATDGTRLRRDTFKIEASPGVYEIKANTGRMIYLVKSRKRLRYPNHRQVVPSLKPKDTYQLKGKGSRFVLWAASTFGCRLDPALIPLRDDESVTLFIQKKSPGLSPAVLQNDTTMVVVMPTRCTDSWVREIEELKVAA
jgi:hypothetical protein